jgi:tetratricopeptide (TPR) repeat protein
MKLDDEDRPVRVSGSYSRPFLSAALVVVVACVAAFALLPEFGDYAKGLVFAVGDAVGIRPPEDQYSAAYKRLGISPLPAKLLASSKISSGLARLAREPCDKAAVFAFGEALLAAHEGRNAADTYLAFAAICPNGEGRCLVAKNPTIASYRYLRGKALANVKRYADALGDYKSTIELQKNPRDVAERVFVEMANIYAAMGRPCDAAVTILAWVAIDSSVRNTLKTRRMVEEYSAKGCAKNPAPTDMKKI